MRRSRFALAAAILAAGIVGGAFLERSMARGTAAIESARLEFREFPGKVGRWRVDRLDLTDRQLELLKVDDYLRADCSSEDGGGSVSVYVGYYRNADNATQHPPTICYPGAGWLLVHDLRAHVNLEGHKRLSVQETVFSRGTERQMVIYWYSQPGYEGANTAWQKVARLRRILSGKAPSGASKIQIALMMDQDRQATQARLEAFLAEFIPELRNFIPQDEKGK